LEEKGCLWFTSESKREREHTSTHTRGRPHTNIREYREVALALPPQEESKTGPWVPELEERESLVLAWSQGYQHHLTNSKLKARQKRLREAELHVLHARTLSHPLFQAFWGPSNVRSRGSPIQHVIAIH